MLKKDLEDFEEKYEEILHKKMVGLEVFLWLIIEEFILGIGVDYRRFE